MTKGAPDTCEGQAVQSELDRAWRHLSSIVQNLVLLEMQHERAQQRSEEEERRPARRSGQA